MGALPDVIRHTALRSSDFPPACPKARGRPSGPAANDLIIWHDFGGNFVRREFPRHRRRIPGERNTYASGSARDLTKPGPDTNEIFQFVSDEIDSVPHLEALLLLRNSHPAVWTAEAMAKRLYVNMAYTESLLRDLVGKGLVSAVQNPGEGYQYNVGNKEKDRVIGRLDQVYRREIVRISTLIHSKASAGVREFARAFEFKRKKEKP